MIDKYLSAEELDYDGAPRFGDIAASESMSMSMSTHTIDISMGCPRCWAEYVTLHTNADQDHEHETWTWYCDAGDRVSCHCGARLTVSLDDDGLATITETR